MRLGNASELYPHGDEIQVAVPWTPPDMWEGINTAVAGRILDQIAAGPGNGHFYSAAPQNQKRPAWAVVRTHCAQLGDIQCKQIVKTWVKNEVLKDDLEYTDPDTRKPAIGVRVLKRPGPIG